LVHGLKFAANFKSRVVCLTAVVLLSTDTPTPLFPPHLFISVSFEVPKPTFFSTGICTQDLELARQVLYHMSHTPSPFYFPYLGEKVSCLHPGQPELYSSYLFFQHSWVTGVYHNVQLLLVEMGSPELFFGQGWPNHHLLSR
jgi:hypothetical protein